MKKIIAVAVVAVLMLAMASQAFGLVIDAGPSSKRPPVYINKLVVADPYMNPFDVRNWSGAASATAYPAHSQIWFIAEIIVAAKGDTDAAGYWVPNSTATLTFTSKDNCLNFGAATYATFAYIDGMNVTTAQISNSGAYVYANTAKAEFTLTGAAATGIAANGVPTFTNSNGSLANLRMNAIYDKNTIATSAFTGNTNVQTKASVGATYYMLITAATNEATEGLCIGTLKIAGWGDFEWDGVYDMASPSRTAASVSNTKIRQGEQSIIRNLYNPYNGKTYTIMKISNVGGPYTAAGVMYVLMNKDADENVISFVVDGSYRGLAKWRNDTHGTGYHDFDVTNTSTTPSWAAIAANYDAVGSNDLSGGAVNLQYLSYNRSNGDAISKAELQAIFDFFGFAYANPVAPGDGDFLRASGFTTVAEAKYNVANAVVPVPDTQVDIPKTGDAATSTGMILAISAILAAAAVGFVLSKRAHN